MVRNDMAFLPFAVVHKAANPATDQALVAPCSFAFQVQLELSEVLKLVATLMTDVDLDLLRAAIKTLNGGVPKSVLVHRIAYVGASTAVTAGDFLFP